MMNEVTTHFSKLPARSYKKHWSMVNPGDNLKTIYLLKKGCVKLYALSKEGKELTFMIYKPGDFFPFFAALIPSLYPYWIETMTPAEIISIPVDKFMDYFKNKPSLFLGMTVQIMGRFDKILQRMEYLAFGNAEEKMASILLILSEQFGKKGNGAIKIDVPLTHKEVANLVGLTRETASNIMSGYVKKEYLEYQGRYILIKNKKGLFKESLLAKKL